MLLQNLKEYNQRHRSKNFEAAQEKIFFLGIGEIPGTPIKQSCKSIKDKKRKKRALDLQQTFWWSKKEPTDDPKCLEI